jgi:hypothetical protein
MSISIRPPKHIVKMAHKIVENIILLSLDNVNTESLTKEESELLLKQIRKIADCHKYISES